MSTRDTTAKVAVGVRIDRDVARLARIHRAETGESVTQLVNRLLRQEFGCTNKPRPAA